MIERRPALLLLARDVCFFHGLRQAEVAELCIQMVVQYHVHRFEVAVHRRQAAGLVVVQKLYPCCDVERHAPAALLVERDALRVEQIKQVATRHVLQHDAQLGGGHHRAENRHQFGMLQLLQRVHLLPELEQQVGGKGGRGRRGTG